MTQMYFIESLQDTPQCTIRATYRSAVVSNGFVELDPVDDKPLIDAYKAVEREAPKAKKVTKELPKLEKVKATKDGE